MWASVLLFGGHKRTWTKKNNAKAKTERGKTESPAAGGEKKANNDEKGTQNDDKDAKEKTERGITEKLAPGTEGTARVDQKEGKAGEEVKSSNMHSHSLKFPNVPRPWKRSKKSGTEDLEGGAPS